MPVHPLALSAIQVMALVHLGVPLMLLLDFLMMVITPWRMWPWNGLGDCLSLVLLLTTMSALLSCCHVQLSLHWVDFVIHERGEDDGRVPRPYSRFLNLFVKQSLDKCRLKLSICNLPISCILEVVECSTDPEKSRLLQYDNCSATVSRSILAVQQVLEDMHFECSLQDSTCYIANTLETSHEFKLA